MTFNFWWSAEWSEQQTLTEMQKKNKQTNKRPPMSSNNKMLIFGLCSTSDDQPSDLSIEHWLKTKKKMKEGPLCHWKIKCSVLAYIQLLMISHAIQATKVNWNVEKGPLSDWKMKYSLLYYIQLLMIGQAIQVMKVYQNVKKWHVSVMVFCCFSLGLLYAFPPPPGWQGRN